MVPDRSRREALPHKSKHNVHTNNFCDVFSKKKIRVRLSFSINMSNLGLRCLSSSNASRTTAISRLKSRWGTRNIHQRRSLLYPIEDGLGEFLPPAALKAVAVDYHDGLLQRLNEEVQGESRGHSSRFAHTHAPQEPSNRTSVSFRH